jgi:hypothetical protein
MKSDFVRRTGEVSIAEQSKIFCEMPGLFALAQVLFRVPLCERGRTTLQDRKCDRYELNVYERALHFPFAPTLAPTFGSESHFSITLWCVR